MYTYIHIFYMIFHNSSKCMHAPFSSRFKRHQENNSSPECIHAPPQDNKNTIALKFGAVSPIITVYTPFNRPPLPQFGKYSSSFAVNFQGSTHCFREGVVIFSLQKMPVLPWRWRQGIHPQEFLWEINVVHQTLHPIGKSWKVN